MLLTPLLAAAMFAPATQNDLRCVAVLGVVAYEQTRGGRWGDLPPVTADGERFAGIVGERAMAEAKTTREAVRDRIFAEVKALQAKGDLTPGEIVACHARALAVAPKPDVVRCAARMALAADRVKARDGLTSGVKDLATLASVLAYRAKTEGGAKGLSEAQVADAIAAERKAAEAGPDNEEELMTCSELAAAE